MSKIWLAATVVMLAVLTALIVYVGVARQSPASSSSSAELTVAATIFPLADITRQVAGEHVNVVLVIPPGVSEHVSALTPQQIQQLKDAPVLFAIGNGLEDQLVKRLNQALPHLTVTTVDIGIIVKEYGAPEAETHEEEAHEEEEEAGHAHTGLDPHYWLTVPNAMHITDNIAATLKEIDPTHAADYDKNASDYQQELRQLETELQQQASRAPEKNFIAMHNAWSYFAPEYGFNLLATYEPIEGQEPSLNNIRELQALVREHEITSFYAEPQKTNSHIAEFMEKELGLEIRTLDPIGGNPGTESYIDLMKFNINSLTGEN
jgi:zinc transport system substrate-binding protein